MYPGSNLELLKGGVSRSTIPLSSLIKYFSKARIASSTRSFLPAPDITAQD
ncbi:hypothetical protein D3C80_1920910 [compost metagenome]